MMHRLYVCMCIQSYLLLLLLPLLQDILLGRMGVDFDPFHPLRPLGTLRIFTVSTAFLGVAGLACSTGFHLRHALDKCLLVLLSSDIVPSFQRVQSRPFLLWVSLLIFLYFLKDADLASKYTSHYTT